MAAKRQTATAARTAAHQAPSRRTDPPPRLSAREALHWDRYLRLLPRGLGRHDAAAFEQLAVFSAQLEELEDLRRQGGVQSHFVKRGDDVRSSPLMTEIRSTTDTVIRLLREFGLTPRGRGNGHGFSLKGF